MAFEWAGDLGGAAPVKRYFQIGADMYQGQLAAVDFSTTTGGYITPAVVAEAGPSVTQHILGICSAIVTSPTYTAGVYNGDLGSYDTTTTTQQANDPKGPALAEVILVTPTTLIKAPIWHATTGAVMHCLAATTAVSAGTTFVTSGFDAAVDSYSTAYCRTGTNAGQYRVITATGTTTQACAIAFTYGVAIGDTFVVANIVEGNSRFDFTTTSVNAINGTAALTNYYTGYVHEVNLKESGREYAIFTLSSSHLVIGGSGVTS
jgi:hypothetical protein